MKRIISVYERAVSQLTRIEAVGPLLARLSIGGMFLTAGWGKLHSLEGVTSFFSELGIPAAAFNAHLVAVTEFAGGLALLLGLGTRLAALPLAFTMVIAILTARLEDVEGLLSFVALEEFTYLAVLVWMAVAGGGRLSVDALIRRRAPRAESTATESATLAAHG